MRTMQISHLFFEMWADPSFKLQWGVPAELLPLPAVLPAVLLQLLCLFGLIPSHFPGTFPALTALSFCTVCCLWPDTSEKQESAQGLQLQDSVRPYHHLDTLNKLQLQEKKQKKRNQKSAIYHTNSCKPWIIYRAELLWQVIRLLKGRSNLQTSHSLVANCILFRISYHTSDTPQAFMHIWWIWRHFGLMWQWVSNPLLPHENGCWNKKSTKGAAPSMGSPLTCCEKKCLGKYFRQLW